MPRQQQELRSAMGKPATQDPQLSRIMDELYRDNASVGSGSTAAAVRHELATGQPSGGRSALRGRATRSSSSSDGWPGILRRRPGTGAAAEYAIKDMQDALARN